MSRHPDDERRPPVPTGARDWDAIRAVIRKDLTAVRRSKAIALPMILVPLVLLVAMPVSLGLFARSADSSQVARVLSSPVVSSVTDDIVRLPEREQLVVLVLGYLLSPLLLVIPLMVSAVLAADAFAGEKERRTLESVLHLPISDADLYLAKVLGAYLPAVTITWVSAVVYAVVTNLVGWPAMGRIFIPFQQWTAMILWVAPAVALLSLGLLVFVSSKARTTQEANQLGGAVILPLIFVAASQATALLLVPLLGVALAGLVLWGIAVALVAAGSSRFTRDRLATSA